MMATPKADGLTDLVPRFLRDVDTYVESVVAWRGSLARIREWEPRKRATAIEEETENLSRAMHKANATVVSEGHELASFLEREDALALLGFLETKMTTKVVAHRSMTEWTGLPAIRARLKLALIRGAASTPLVLTSKPKRPGRPKNEFTNQRAEFAKKRIEAGDSWPQATAAYKAKYPDDRELKDDALRTAFDSVYRASKSEKTPVAVRSHKSTKKKR